MGWFRKKEEIIRKKTSQERPATKKGKCRIKFKKTADGEIIEFSPECTNQQIEMAKKMREEREGQ